MRPPRALVAVLALATVLVVQAPTALATQPPSGIGVQLLDAAASQRNDPRAYLYIVDRLRAGATITRHVRVTNYTKQVAGVSIYAAAASIGGGQFRFADGHTGNDLTSWTFVTPSGRSLAPQAHVDATVRIAVPKDATSGERYAVVWAQVSSPAGTGIRQSARVGVRIYLDVAGTRQASAFAIAGITATRDQGGRPRISAQVHNTGQRALDVAGTVHLSHGPGGLQLEAVRTDATLTITPGGTGSVSAAFDPQLPAGPWVVTVDLASGTVHHHVSATVTFPGAAATQVVIPIHAKHHDSPWRWWLLGSALVLLAIGGVAVWLTLRHRAAAGEPSSAG